jgi:nucleotide-binding universal stress UspA family protein
MNKKILVTLDGSEIAEQILPYVEDYGRIGYEIHLLRVSLAHPLHKMKREEVEEHVVEEAEKYLEHIRDKLRKKGFTVEAHVLYGKAAEKILDFAETQKFDVIALTTHGLSGIGRWVMGSVAEKIVRTSQVPVYVVRAQRP